ncbi:chromatin binding [Blomia tropicalis]|nr:chromatin binding [Blomia tropicalis]
MSKRKRQDSPTSIMNVPPINEIESCNINEDVTTDEAKQEAIKKHENEGNLVNSSDNNVQVTVNCDNLNSRRKSNRILSLKKSVNFNQQNSPLVDEGLIQTVSNNNNESSVSDLTNNSDPKTIQSSISSDNGIGSNLISSCSSQVSSSNQINQQNNNSKNVSQNISAVGKSLRKNQVWTEDHTRWFFEALCEHGKDFNHIQTYIAARCEKKGISSDMIKNYEQVRHYYYRMWHKISQMLKISNAIEKGVQEIYGLINYGEIWKKFGSKFDAKSSAHLQQLVDHGYAVFKVKGKSVRVRTPICNALKKIHNIQTQTIEKPITQSIPKEITVELIPATNSDWIHVHSLAQNPRLRTKLAMQYRLSTLISYLERRWSLFRHKENISKELFNSSLCKEDNSTQLAKKSFFLCLRPQNTEKLNEQVLLKSTSNSISMNSYRSTHSNSQIDLSLSSYMKNLFNEDMSMNDNKKSKIRKGSAKKGSCTTAKEKPKDVSEIATVEEPEKDLQENERPLDLFKMLDSMNEELEKKKNKPEYDKSNNETDFNDLNVEVDNGKQIAQDNIELSQLSEPPAHTTLAQWLAGNPSSSLSSSERIKENTTNCEKIDNNDKSSLASPNFPQEVKNKKRRGSIEIANNEMIHLLSAKQARLGWTFEDAQSVTIGEIYLLFSCPSKIVLEYLWTENVEKVEEIGNDCQMEKNDNESAPLESSEFIKQTSCSSLLQKLLIAANFTLSNLKRPSNLASINSTIGRSSVSSNKMNRKRPPKNELLSTLIQETILDDDINANANSDNLNTDLNPETKQVSNQEILASAEIKKKGQLSKVSTQKDRTQLQHQVKSKHRTTPVMDDPTKVEEVLKELKASNSRRQRRPLSKPFIYNLQNKVLNSKKLVNGTHSALLVIPASTGQPSKQILLTDLLTNHIPQASISLSNATNSMSDQNHMTTVNQIQSNEHQQLNNASSVLIPIHVERKTIASDIPISSGKQELQLQQSKNTQMNEIDQIESIPHFISGNGDDSNINESKSLSDSKKQKQTDRINITKPSTAETHSQLSWLNEVDNDYSLGSLLTACDIPNEDNTTQKLINNGTTLSSMMQTQMNSLTNDNSVDLIAKFADLAAQISSEVKMS